MQQPSPTGATEILPASPPIITQRADVVVDSPFGELPHLDPKIVAMPGENPALRGLPKYSSATQALRALEYVPDNAEGDLSADGHILVGTAVHGSLLLDLSASARVSAGERNLGDARFQAKVMTAHQFLHQKEANRDSVVPATVSLPGVQAKVHFAVVGHGLGQRALINACQRVFGKSNRPVDVPVADGGGWIRFFRMDTLVHEFPSNGSPQTFYRTLARKVDGMLNTGFRLGHFASRRRSDEEVTSATQALMLSINVGILIIGPVSTRESDPIRAASMWSLLATLAAETGIPILVVATAGAAANLIEHSGAQPDLSRGGVYDFAPYGLSSKTWRNVVLAIWVKYLRAFAKTPPDWFYTALWAQSLGRIELAVKIASHIARFWASSNYANVSLTQAELRKHAHTALALETPRLNAIRRADTGGNFSRAQVMRNGDWLPLEMVIKSLPELDATDDWFTKRHYRSTKLVGAMASLPAINHESARENSASQSSGIAP
ncbi:MAG TPA: hypothetical protein VJU59_11590 [Paraburkholderia sp.]|uniref:hypothetical protein n=1 Tax=Paraburkholderia sp. TaxID=1926495 RepID=UPI002B483F3D|nr:hypothetical protein [Paraburkholderia sp.]HKR40301.1 hypothetical protein [Paraburkholderia sp.]